MPFVPGTKSTVDNNGSTVVLDLADGLQYLNPSNDGLAILKRIGTDGFTYANHKNEWRETELARRAETITLADGVGTALTVADAYQYQVDTVLACEAERMLVTAIANATTLTITRGYAGTTGAAHAAKQMMTLGTAKKEGDDASSGLTDNGTPLFNYDQIFERGVALTNHEIAALSVGGDKLSDQLERRFIEANRELFQAVLYGQKSQDTVNKRWAMGGLVGFLSSNVTNVAGAVSISAIDALLLKIVEAGGDPKTIGVHPYQAQKLAALDTNYQNIGKRERTGGALKITTWQSMVVPHDIEIIQDLSYRRDELHINDWDHIKIGHLDSNGVNGNWKVVNPTKPGANREERTIRGTFSMKVELEKGQGYLYGLS